MNKNKEEKKKKKRYQQTSTRQPDGSKMYKKDNLLRREMINYKTTKQN